uniref:Uncharacterized protein n=1 Tax=Anguilla anguilla TaxID=7936 RepID=A0A0E9TCL0_ANGAN
MASLLAMRPYFLQLGACCFTSVFNLIGLKVPLFM